MRDPSKTRPINEDAVMSIRHVLISLGCALGLIGCGGGGGSTPPPPPPPPPSITSQPVALTVNAGSAAIFRVVATGAASYQWERNSQNIAGATGSSYTLSPATSANNGDSYTVVVSNAGGNVRSSAATLRVTGVSVLAGQIGGEGYADGPASQARFWGPSSLALDPGGNLYVTDFNAVRKITPAGDVSTVVGSPRSCGEQAGNGAAARLCYPFTVALDAAGALYVADYGGNTVWHIDANATMSAYSTQFTCIESLAISGSVLFVGDSCGGLGTIKTIDTAAPAAPAAFASINGPIAGFSFDAAQNIYVADDTTIDKVSAGPVVTTLAGTQDVHGSADGTGSSAQFGCVPFYYGPNLIGTTGATAIATLPSGDSYVADYCHNTIRTVSSTGVVATLAGTAGLIGTSDGTGQNATFYQPAAIVIDPSGNLFVADYDGATIRKVTPAGVVTTYAGQTPHVGHTDGAASQATFCAPFGVAADSAGNLYVTDTFNYVIRKITPAGSVSTIAGIPGTPGSVNGAASVATFSYPQGMAIDAGGNLYVNDLLNNSVRKITPAGAVTTFAVGPLPMGFQQLAGIAVDAEGNVYMTDRRGIYEVPAAGGEATQIAMLTGATAITATPDGTMYVTAGQPFTSGTGAVYAMSTAHALTLVTSTGLSARLPAIVMGGDGNLYVSDLANSVIDQVTLGGKVTAVAGTPDLPIGTAPGGLPAKLNSPNGLALLSTGTSVSMAVVDSFENAVLRLDLP
jgi:sugar lactone lactonase YvrE